LNAGAPAATGVSNSFFGAYAGDINTTGSSNSYFGYNINLMKKLSQLEAKLEDLQTSQVSLSNPSQKESPTGARVSTISSVPLSASFRFITSDNRDLQELIKDED
jgi:hypothetical protein